MILQAETNCWLTEAKEDIKPEERHFAKTVPVRTSLEAANWRQVTDSEKEKMLQEGTIFDASQLSPAYLDKVDTLLAKIPKAMNLSNVADGFDAPATALKYMKYYPEWGDLWPDPVYKNVGPGFRMQHNGKLWEVRQFLELQEQWEPGAQGTEALYTLVQADYEENPDGHSGTLEDPIPYEGNQMLEEGKYYSQDGKVYLCTRDSGIPLTHALSELVGLYVEEITENN